MRLWYSGIIGLLRGVRRVRVRVSFMALLASMSAAALDRGWKSLDDGGRVVTPWMP